MVIGSASAATIQGQFPTHIAIGRKGQFPTHIAIGRKGKTMSKYYKAEDVIRAIAEQLCWEARTEYGDKFTTEDWLEEAEDYVLDLPTIEVSEDAISREYLEEQLQQIEDITAMAHIDLGEDPYDETEEITMPISTVRKIFKNAPSVVPSRSKR